MHTVVAPRVRKVGSVPSDGQIDAIDARILRALNDEPRATVLALAEKTGLSRNTVQARLSRLERDEVLLPFDRRIDPSALGFPLSAFIFTSVTQRSLATIAEALDAIPEVVQVHGLSGVTDLLIQAVARDADDLYRIAGRILDIEGVEKTTTSLVMHRLVDHRVGGLLDRLADEPRA
ncbi:AsnC family transcriptional regulator [Gordonia terrae]|uniref:AsnC family transcriptional regulator n=1 Tax=Gordonia terrae TaxID=2055 RepID=A0A2I1R8Q8_9ACTN|nr:Lrp/AsnC family transcriptional regulator [Gordonia terrae]PKZ65496.1 AsnC family transcriptional regulator [Gordonia terrae]